MYNGSMAEARGLSSLPLVERPVASLVEHADEALCANPCFKFQPDFFFLVEGGDYSGPPDHTIHATLTVLSPLTTIRHSGPLYRVCVSVTLFI